MNNQKNNVESSIITLATNMIKEMETDIPSTTDPIQANELKEELAKLKNMVAIYNRR